MQQGVELNNIVPLSAADAGGNKISHALPAVDVALIGPSSLGQSRLLNRYRPLGVPGPSVSSV